MISTGASVPAAVSVRGSEAVGNAVPPRTVGVLRALGEYRLVAICRLPAGTPLFTLEGEAYSKPSRFSVQTGRDVHIDQGATSSHEEVLDRYFWRFMNHSCDPNTMIRDRQAVARREMLQWEPVTFNYNTTEWEMAEPFVCHCGSPVCLGIIRGYKHLTPQQRRLLHPTAAPHLENLASAEG